MNYGVQMSGSTRTQRIISESRQELRKGRVHMALSTVSVLAEQANSLHAKDRKKLSTFLKGMVEPCAEKSQEAGQRAKDLLSQVGEV
jgi:hypothetical protein